MMPDDTPLAGKGDELTGKAKEVAGKATGDEDMEAEGKGQQVRGRVEGLAHDIKEGAEDAIDSVLHRKEDK